MDYEEYKILVNKKDYEFTNEEMSFIQYIESITDNIMYFYFRENQDIETASVSARKMMEKLHEISDDDLNLGLECAYDYLRLHYQCKNEGHIWEDASYCTPDSGGMFVVCTRCGFKDGSRLY